MSKEKALLICSAAGQVTGLLVEGLMSWNLHGPLAVKGLVELHAQVTMDEAHAASTATMLMLWRGVTTWPQLQHCCDLRTQR